MASVVVTSKETIVRSDGPPGPRGASILGGHGAPTIDDGQNGDFWVDLDNSRLYGPKDQEDGWTTYVYLGGPRGSAVLNGAGAPVSGDGLDGDFWMDTTNQRMYGPKTAGAWGGYFSVVGPKGWIAARSNDPTVNMNGGPLASGDLYYNTVSNKTRIYDGTEFEDYDKDAQAARVATGQDRTATALDRIATGEDVVETGEDRVATGQDRVQTGQDRVGTGQDRVQTGLDRVQTGLDRVATGQDVALTHADVALTHADVLLTHADVIASTAQVGLVNAAGATQIGLVNTAGGTQTGLVNAAGGTQTGLVNAAGASNISTINTTAAMWNASISSFASALVYPNSAAANIPYGLAQSGVAFTPGTGGTPGTYALTYTGSGTNLVFDPGVTVVVGVGGTITSVTVNGPGLLIGATRAFKTPNLAAITGLTGATITLTPSPLVGPGAGYWVFAVDGNSVLRYNNVAGVATVDPSGVSLPTVQGIVRQNELTEAALFAQGLYSDVGTGSIKAIFDYKGPRTPYLGSATIMTGLTSLDKTPISLGLYSTIYTGPTAEPRPVYTTRGIKFSSQTGLEITGSPILPKTSGNFCIIHTVDLDNNPTPINLVANLPTGASIVEGEMFLVTGDTNTTAPIDIKTVMDQFGLTDAQLVNGYFKGQDYTDVIMRGPYTLVSFYDAGTLKYIRILLNHIGQLRCSIYNGVGGGIESYYLGKIAMGSPLLTIAMRRFGDQLMIYVNGQPFNGPSIKGQTSITDLTRLYINGRTRTGNPAAPIIESIPHYWKGMVIADDVPEANFIALYNRIANRYGSNPIVRARRVRGVFIMGQSWTGGAIDASSDTWQSPTVSGQNWNGQVTRNNPDGLFGSGEHKAITRQSLPNVFGSLTTDATVVLSPSLLNSTDIGNISFALSAAGGTIAQHGHSGGDGETFATSMMHQINAHPSGLGLLDDWIHAGVGAGGATIAVLTARYTGPWLPTQLKTAVLNSQDLMFLGLRQIVCHKEWANARGQPYTVDVFAWQQGHSDSSNMSYFANIIAMYDQFCLDVKAITGQSHNPIFICPQTSNSDKGKRNRSNTDASVDQVFLELEDTGRTSGLPANFPPRPFYCAGPIYPLTNHIHPPRTGHIWCGEVIGKSLARILFEGSVYGSMRPISYTGGAPGSSAISIGYSTLPGRGITLVDQNDNNIAARVTTAGVDTFGYEFYRRILGRADTGYVTISPTTGLVTFASHGLVNDDKFFFSTTNGILPTGYSTETEYFVRSLTNTVTMNFANPVVVTWNAHGMLQGQKIVLTTNGALPSPLVAGTAYYLINVTTNAFGLSATLNGAAISTLGSSQSGTHTATSLDKFGVAATSGGAQIATSGASSLNIYVYDTTVKISSVVIPSSVVTMNIGVPVTITWANHGLAIGDKVVFSTTGALPTGLTVGTEYYILPGGFTTGQFRLGLSPNTAFIINTTGTQSGTHTCTSRDKIVVSLSAPLAGTVGSLGVLKYVGESTRYGNVCDGPKVDGLFHNQDYTVTFVNNEPPYTPGPLNDVRQWASASTKYL